MKTWVLVLAVSFATATSFGSLGFAEDMQGMENEPQQAQGMMMGGPGEGMMGSSGKGNPGMMGKMMGMMPKESLVATSDGGVVVLAGPRLLKYDADLMLVKEVELPKGKGPGQPDMKSNQGTGDPIRQ